MGKLIYAGTAYTISDDIARNLDMVLSTCHTEGLTFQLHLTFGGEADWALRSFTVGAGCELVLEYTNTPFEINVDSLVGSLDSIRSTGLLSLETLQGL